MTVTLFDQFHNIVEVFTDVSDIQYNKNLDRFEFLFYDGGGDNVWANGGSLGVEA